MYKQRSWLDLKHYFQLFTFRIKRNNLTVIMEADVLLFLFNIIIMIITV